MGVRLCRCGGDEAGAASRDGHGFAPGNRACREVGSEGGEQPAGSESACAHAVLWLDPAAGPTETRPHQGCAPVSCRPDGIELRGARFRGPSPRTVTRMSTLTAPRPIKQPDDWRPTSHTAVLRSHRSARMNELVDSPLPKKPRTLRPLVFPPRRPRARSSRTFQYASSRTRGRLGENPGGATPNLVAWFVKRVSCLVKRLPHSPASPRLSSWERRPLQRRPRCLRSREAPPASRVRGRRRRGPPSRRRHPSPQKSRGRRGGV
jgi:hypothetical protein